MRNIKLVLQFDGSCYHGWQVQPNAVTVQEVVSNAVFAVTGERPNLIGCGRTDAGVHALRYVCNFRTNTRIPIEKIPYALNTKLPQDIVCHRAEDVPAGFHANTSAVKKRYTYHILNTPLPDAFSYRYAWHYKAPLDVEAMRRAAKAFIGTHDFIGFASSGFTVQTTVRTIYSLQVSRRQDNIVLDIVGDGFLYNMVRIITGTLAAAGSGRIPPEEMPEILASCDRSRAGITAPPNGLFLSEVWYGER